MNRHFLHAGPPQPEFFIYIELSWQVKLMWRETQRPLSRQNVFYSIMHDINKATSNVNVLFDHFNRHCFETFLSITRTYEQFLVNDETSAASFDQYVNCIQINWHLPSASQRDCHAFSKSTKSCPCKVRCFKFIGDANSSSHRQFVMCKSKNMSERSESSLTL